MRVMVFVKATEDSETGQFPEPWTSEMMAAMGRFNDELRDAGILLAADGLKPSSQGKRVAFDGPGRTVIDALRRDPRTGRGLLDLGGQGHGRSGRLGKALPQSDDGTGARSKSGRFTKCPIGRECPATALSSPL